MTQSANFKKVQDLITVKRSKRARRVALRLDPVQRIINLVIPERMPLRTAYAFANKHEDWIKQTLNNLPEKISFTHGTQLPVFGDKIWLDITIDPTIRRTTLKQYDDRLFVKTYQQDPTSRITTHLKKIARMGLADMASEKAGIIGKDIASVTIRDTKSRWGSCSADGHLSFSWRLIFAPYAAVDYVIAHEIAHLVHLNHSKSFWELCEKLSCDYKTGKHWMKKRGNTLLCYGQKN
ncbi:MAG: M48 family metallopeptidase [Alphaproteobacteria bacterium]